MFISVPLTNIDPNPLRDLAIHPVDPDRIERAAASLTLHGQVGQLAVRPSANGRYELADGHARLEAAKRLGMDALELHATDRSDQQMISIQLGAAIGRVPYMPLLIDCALSATRLLGDARSARKFLAPIMRDVPAMKEAFACAKQITSGFLSPDVALLLPTWRLMHEFRRGATRMDRALVPVERQAVLADELVICCTTKRKGECSDVTAEKIACGIRNYRSDAAKELEPDRLLERADELMKQSETLAGLARVDAQNEALRLSRLAVDINEQRIERRFAKR